MISLIFDGGVGLITSAKSSLKGVSELFDVNGKELWAYVFVKDSKT